MTQEKTSMTQVKKVLVSFVLLLTVMFAFYFISTSKTLLLLVFSIDGPKQNAGSLLTLVSHIVYYALSHGTLGFAVYGSLNNH